MRLYIIITPILVLILLIRCDAIHKKNTDSNVIQIINTDSIENRYVLREYYSSGNLKREEIIFNDKLFGEAHYYYDELDTFLIEESGEYYIATQPYLEKYRFFNSRGNVAFEWTYWKDGNIINSFGSTIIEYYFPEHVIQNDSIDFVMTIPRPFKGENLLFIGEVVNGRIEKLDELSIIGKSANVRGKYIFTSSGEKTLAIISKITHIEQNKVMIDTAMFSVKVD